MADKFITELTQNSAPLGSDMLVLEDDPAGTPLTQYLRASDLNLLPDGYMVNGKISVTVSANNITVALKTKSGGNPSTSDPVSVWINGTFRRCTAALSVTKNAGTNWFASGAAELAAKEQDYFVYLIWNTTPATDIVDLGFARIPYARVFSDFSTTTTNALYCAFANASTPTSTNDVTVIGRFAATLSAGAGYTWSVPTFTSTNLIQHPITETRWLTWQPTYTGFSANPSGLYRYQVSGRCVRFAYKDTSVGTSSTTAYTATLPFAAINIAGMEWHHVPGYATDNATPLTSPALMVIAANSATATFYKTLAAGAWTGSSTKSIAGVTGFYEI